MAIKNYFIEKRLESRNYVNNSICHFNVSMHFLSMDVVTAQRFQ
jgi:hypothetical protein